MNNSVVNFIDWLGGWRFEIVGSSTHVGYNESGSFYELNGKKIWLERIRIDGSISATVMGQGSALAINISASFLVYNQARSINETISINFGVTLYVDSAGTVSSSPVSGSTSDSRGAISISGTGGITSNLNLAGTYSSTVYNQYMSLIISNISYNVVE